MKKWGDRLKKVEQLAQSFQKNPLTVPYKPRLWPCQPSSIWKLFPRQSLAISFARSCKENVHIFALEKEKWLLGQRIFLVTSYSELWHYYRTFPQSLMHCYEVIPEGAVCKLYFDLEFHKSSNPGADGRAMVSFLIQYVCEKLKEVYGIGCSAKDVLNLDSSTDAKFSRHLIFNLRNAAFKDNTHVGKFIHGILQEALISPEHRRYLETGTEEDGGTHIPHTQPNTTKADMSPVSPQTKRRKQEDRDFSFLWVKNKDGQPCLFVDLGVYTKNRNFRLYKSSKVGKNAAFCVAEDNSFTAAPEKGLSAEESLFLASLVCNVSFTGQKILTWDRPDAKTCRTTTPRHHQRSATDTGPLTGFLSSPHGEVDNFVLSVVNRDGIQGCIRRWNYFASEQLLVYDIAKYRWCENVERFHKSNNIMIVVDLKEETWYQKCHDPECKSFRSSSRPLPQEICLSYIMTMQQDEEEPLYSMDDLGNIELSQKQPSLTAEDEAADVWGDEHDDRVYLEMLDDFERNTGEVSDQLLLECVADFESR